MWHIPHPVKYGQASPAPTQRITTDRPFMQKARRTFKCPPGIDFYSPIIGVDLAVCYWQGACCAQTGLLMAPTLVTWIPPPGALQVAAVDGLIFWLPVRSEPQSFTVAGTP